jgi:hypothetical protein
MEVREIARGCGASKHVSVSWSNRISQICCSAQAKGYPVDPSNATYLSGTRRSCHARMVRVAAHRAQHILVLVAKF